MKEQALKNSLERKCQESTNRKALETVKANLQEIAKAVADSYEIFDDVHMLERTNLSCGLAVCRMIRKADVPGGSYRTFGGWVEVIRPDRVKIYSVRLLENSEYVGEETLREISSILVPAIQKRLTLNSIVKARYYFERQLPHILEKALAGEEVYGDYFYPADLGRHA